MIEFEFGPGKDQSRKDSVEKVGRQRGWVGRRVGRKPTR